MKGSELFTHLGRSIVGPRSLRSVALRTSVLAALGALSFLVSCGKSSEPIRPTMNGTTGASLQTEGTSPLASLAFASSISELTLITQTSGTSGWVTILSAPIKTSGAKGIYVSASLETGLFTHSLVSSKNNLKDSSTGSASIQVQALIDGTPMPPGTVTYAARTQTLPATLEGAIAGCLSANGTTVVLDPNCVTREEIDLILSTLSASSFNFVASGLPGGDHTVTLQARISSSTSVQQGSASAEALVGKGAMVAQVIQTAK
jgi:hypothetical protein